MIYKSIINNINIKRKRNIKFAKIAPVGKLEQYIIIRIARTSAGNVSILFTQCISTALKKYCAKQV